LWCFSAAEWRALFFSVSSSSEIKFEKEVVLHDLLHKKLKNRHKFGVHPLLNSMRISGIFHAVPNGTLFFPPISLQYGPTVPHSWTGFTFGNKRFGVNAVARYVEINTSRKNSTPARLRSFEVAPLNTLVETAPYATTTASCGASQLWRYWSRRPAFVALQFLTGYCLKNFPL
jgi:hypothetical protein